MVGKEVHVTMIAFNFFILVMVETKQDRESNSGVGLSHFYLWGQHSSICGAFRIVDLPAFILRVGT